MQAVNKQFGKTEVIRDVALDIDDGEFVVFVGPSGCGKSTLLRLVAGLEEVSAGAIAFDQQDVTELQPAERGVAMVFQSYALYPHMNVFDNMAFGLKLAKTGKQAIKERVNAAARTLQIEHLLHRRPRELSGGQRQRVAIGRAIVRQPRVFLFDEPLSNLDAALRVQMRLELKRLHRELGTTMIYVTHDQVEAMTMADRIVVLNAGRVEQVGTPLELYRHPRNLFVAGFIGSPTMNLLAVTVTEVAENRVTVQLANGVKVAVDDVDFGELKPGAEMTLGLRPEHLPLEDAESARDTAAMEGEVVVIEHLGAEAYIHIDISGDEPLVVKSPGHVQLAVGQRVAVNVSPGICHLFDHTGLALRQLTGDAMCT